MRILCAPDSFKETISAPEAAAAMVEGVRAAGAEADPCPMADGGEGSLDVLIGAQPGGPGAAAGGQIRRETVCGPRGDPVEARWALLRDGRTAIVEMAEASGLGLLDPADRDPAETTSFGTGELIRLAERAGARRVIVFLGGSATCDGGAGLAQALGVRFHDRAGRLITEPLTGGALAAIGRIDRSKSAGIEIIAACDVRNPLCGPDGAAAIYAPQKGATPAQVRDLDDGLATLAGRAAGFGGDPEAPGMGAAGGTAYGLATLLGATLRSGVEVILDTVNFDARCAAADLVLTGEGRLDAQSASGKAVWGVAQVAARHNVPCIAIVGDTGPGAETCLAPAGPLECLVSLTALHGREVAISRPAELLTAVAHEIAAVRLA